MYSAQLELVHEKLKPGGEHSKYVGVSHYTCVCDLMTDSGDFCIAV